MSQTPVLDWSCSQCGASETYTLVPSAGEHASAPPVSSGSTLPTLDWSCAHCGASQSYNLVPMAAVSR